MGRKTNKNQVQTSDEIFLQKIRGILKDSTDPDFFKKIDSLESPSLKAKLLNTLSIYEHINNPSKVAEYCRRPIFTRLEIEQGKTIVDVLAENGYESEVLELFKRDKHAVSDSIWSIAVNKKLNHLVAWLLMHDLDGINTPMKGD